MSHRCAIYFIDERLMARLVKKNTADSDAEDR